VCVCVCVCAALVTQHAMRMRHIVICGLPRSTIFLHVFEEHDLRRRGEGGFTDHKIRILTSSITLSEIFIILRKTERNMIKKYILLFK